MKTATKTKKKEHISDNPKNLNGVEFDPKNPNAILILDFNYKAPEGFIGDEWKRYNDMLEQLCPEKGHSWHSDTNFDWELWRAMPIFKQRYPGLPQSPIDLVGISIRPDADPLVSTRISIKTARNYNAQIENAHSRAGHGKIYLLKKTNDDIGF